MKNKKVLMISICAAVLVLVLAAIVIVLNLKQAKVVVTFDTDGGSKIEEKTVKKGESITLPSTVKNGYNFMGWYIDNEKVEKSIVVKKNTTLTAKWEKIPENAKTMVVTFDSNGGSTISPITMECNKELTLPESPKRDGYTFRTWEDKNGKSILNGALLSCEDVTLIAQWDKVEEKKQETKKEEPKKEEPKKEYTCPSGYTLEGTKCKTEGTVHTTCPEGTKVDGNLCIKTSDYSQGTRTCGTKIVNMGGGSTPTVQGVKVEAGTTFCYYGEVPDDKDTCTSRGRKWCNSLSKCFIDMDQNYKTECPSDREYYSTADMLNKFGAHTNGGCYKKVDKTLYCDAEYALINGKCIKTIDATLK